MEARRAAALIALAAAVVAVVLILFQPFASSPYTITANVDNAGQLIPGNDVRMGAVTVGNVSDVSLADDGTANIKMEINADHAPLPEGTAAAIRSYSLFGLANRFVVLETPPGPERGTLPDGGTISLANTTSPVDADVLLNTLNGKTRAGLSEFIQGGATMFNGQAQNVNE